MLLSGILYFLLRIGLQYLDIELGTEFSDSPIALIKSLFFMAMEIFVSGYIILQWMNNYYILNESEFTVVTGNISKKEQNYSLKNIQSVSFEQGLWGRIFKYGNVKICTYLN